MRYFVFLEYIGTHYCGIQKQQNKNNSIQDNLEYALKKTFKKDIDITIGSRTDKGVHAYKNCFHFDLEFKINCNRIKKMVNKILPDDIAILSIQQVHQDANSRFSAVKRRYRYVITNKKNVFDIGLYFKSFDLLDVNKMNDAAKYLIGEKSFKTFSKLNKTERHNYECIIYDSFCIKNNDKIIFEIEGNRFTHSLIRGLFYNIIMIGLNKISFDNFKTRLDDCNRACKLNILPSSGLILMDIKYPENIFVE